MRDWREDDAREYDEFVRRVKAKVAKLFGKSEPVKPTPATPRPVRTPTHIGPLTEAQADKVLRGVFGDRVQRCVGCNGVGRTDETCDVYGRHDAVRIDMSCPVCGSKGLMNVVEVAA